MMDLLADMGLFWLTNVIVFTIFVILGRDGQEARKRGNF